MGRAPAGCCDKKGVKKGPWTPDEDIILVSYIQQNGPANWRLVPTYTGLQRCSKSCRLRWTNYLRPGIKRGNFTDQEEKMIFHLQALLGNRWAAIASYLPQRTDNDIKNYWNTHLKKKLRTTLQGHDDDIGQRHGHNSTSSSKGQWERRLQTDIQMAKRALSEALSIDENKSSIGEPSQEANNNNNNNAFHWAPSAQSNTTYATSEENIARLLRSWTTTKTTMTNNSQKPSPKTTSSLDLAEILKFDQSIFNQNYEIERMFGSTQQSLAPHNENSFGSQVPLAVIEKWLLDDASNNNLQSHYISTLNSI
ncbi:hypothetical protein DM860_018040 [Cuscuta australis]|uniref:Uncharacterized protein n=1 Tax=Cuscuta australis TaxID=267555 RepID=A0A328DU64_9ASTE|nr:hypothetical protein DM860_018040 [Cuscuta australis]